MFVINFQRQQSIRKLLTLKVDTHKSFHHRIIKLCVKVLLFIITCIKIFEPTVDVKQKKLYHIQL